MQIKDVIKLLKEFDPEEEAKFDSKSGDGSTDYVEINSIQSWFDSAGKIYAIFSNYKMEREVENDG